MEGMPGRMSHPKDTVEVGGVGSLSQEWRDHPESSEASPKPWLCRGTLRPKQELPRTQEGRAAWGAPWQAELLEVQAGSWREGTIHSSLWPLGEMAQIWA